MSLSTVLSQLLNRSRLNPGKIYLVHLDHGLTVAFRTKLDQTTMQLSRPKPVVPGFMELVACLNAIHAGDPKLYPSKELQDEKNYYLQVILSNPRR